MFVRNKYASPNTISMFADVDMYEVKGEGEGMVFEGKVEFEGEKYDINVSDARDGDYVRFKASEALWEGGGKVGTEVVLVVRAVERRGESGA